MEIIKKFIDNYVHYKTKKDLIVIHGTAGSSFLSAYSWFKNGSATGVSTHFIIDRDGTIYQLFPELNWSYHAGGYFISISKRSFGILLVNWLYLTDDYKSWTGKLISNVFTLSKIWRRKKYFLQITKLQMISLKLLCNYLCDKYNISKELVTEYNTKPLNCIVLHSTFRNDKFDFPPLMFKLFKL